MAKVPSDVRSALKQKANAPVASTDNSLKSLVEKMDGEIKKALPMSVDPVKFTRVVQTALSQNPKLQDCTASSFLGAMMTSAQLGLEPNTPIGLAYLIPYNNKKKDKSGRWTTVPECQFQLGYKGLLELCRRSGQVTRIQARVVYEKDEFRYQYGLHEDIVHNPCMDQDRGKPTHFYAIYHTRDGGRDFAVMTLKEVQEHAKKYSSSYRNGYSSPWTDNFEQMALKTVLKRALKYAPISTELVGGISTDESIKSLPTEASLIEDYDVIEMPNETSFEVYDEEDEIVTVEKEKENDPGVKISDSGQQSLL